MALVLVEEAILLGEGLVEAGTVTSPTVVGGLKVAGGAAATLGAGYEAVSLYNEVSNDVQNVVKRLRSRNIVTPDNTPAKKKSKMSHNSNNPGPGKGVPPFASLDSLDSSSMQDNGDEVPVIPPPKRISKVVPDYFTINLSYAQSISLSTPATEAPIRHVFRLNSIFDPDKTGATVHQPSGRDKFVQFGYKYYRVLSAKVNVTFMNNSDATNGTAQVIAERSILCGYQLTDDDSVFFSDWRAVVEGKRNVHKIIMSMSPVWDGSQRVASFSHLYNPMDWDFHVQNTGTEERWTAIGVDPVLNHYFVLFCANMNQFLVNKVVAFVNITYTVQFREQDDILAIDTT